MANRGRGPIQGQAVRVTQMGSIQGRRADQDSPLATKYTCATCMISYYAIAPKCPMCDMERRFLATQRALLTANQSIEQLTDANLRLAEQLDLSLSIKSALPVCDDNDRLFIKTVLYQWRIDRGVQLSVTHGAKARRGRSLKPPANGFVANFRTRSEITPHICTSMGGLAIAEYFEEALLSRGHDQAIATLMKGFTELLPGATR